MEELLDRLLFLRRFGNSLSDDVRVLISNLFSGVVDDLRRADPTGVQARYRQGRFDAFMMRTRRRIRDWLPGLNKRLKDELAVLGRHQGVAATDRLIATLGTFERTADVRPTPVTQARMRAILNTEPFQGRVLRDHGRRLGAEVVDRIGVQVRLGMSQEQPLDDIVRRLIGRRSMAGRGRIGGVLRTTARNAEAIVRTAVTFTANRGQLETFRENADVLDGVRFTATLDDRTTTLCFPGSTVVRWPGALQNAFRSEYRGEVVVVTTASGKEVTGTPNHPVLTTHGFLPIGELQPGEHVVYTMPFDGPEVGGGDDVGVPARLAELFDALNEPSRSSVLRKRAARADFYGDGAGMHGEVDILVPEGHLWDDLVSSLDDAIVHEALRGLHAPAALRSDGSLAPLLAVGSPAIQTPQVAPVSPQDGPDPLVATAPDLLGYLGWPHPSVEEFQGASSVVPEVGVRLASAQRGHDAGALQQGRHGGGGHAVIARELACAGAGAVRPDHVIAVRREFWDGHVYTLRTGPGIYTAGGVVVQNCLALDGTEWDLDDPDIVVPGEATHYGCRSVLVGLVAWERLGLPRPPTLDRVVRDLSTVTDEELDLAISTRRSRGAFGDVRRMSSAQTATEWFRRQRAAVQNRMVGKGRAELFRKGEITLKDLIGRDLRSEPLEALRN